jgi:hypothetical protein
MNVLYHAILYVILFSASIALIACPAVHLFTCLSNPVRFALLDTSKRPFSSSIEFRHYAWYVVCILGFGFFIYFGIVTIFSWMPRSWQLHQATEGLAYLCAIVGSFGIIQRLSKLAHEFQKLERLREEVGYSLKYVEKKIHQLNTSVGSASLGSYDIKLSEILYDLERDCALIRRSTEQRG